MGLLSNLFKAKKVVTKQFPPIPEWRPNTPVDHDRILESAKHYTNQKLQLSVFRNGTVVLFPAPVSDIEHAAKSCLDKIYNFHPDFKPILMDDGNYLIEYSQPAFTIVYADELDTYWSYIQENHRHGICTDEVLINALGQPNVFDRLGKICLFGRGKMFMDAQAPEILRIFEPIKK